MLVKSKERKEIFFRDIEVGQVFRTDSVIFMKVNLEDDYICCPRCGEDIRINDERGGFFGADLESGIVYEFDPHSTVEPIQGYFIEE